jgi:5-hydroxyisourate hydrolase
VSRSPITTHVLDLNRGRPAAGLAVELWEQADTGWVSRGHANTDADGRASSLLPAGHVLNPGVYRLVFATGDWFAAQNLATFFPEVTLTFEVTDSEHYHVPLLLGPFSFSTYRGS